MYGDHVSFDIREEFNVVIDIPFTQAYSQLESFVSEKRKTQCIYLYLLPKISLFFIIRVYQTISIEK